MSFLVLPPEINSALMFSGAGSAPRLKAAVPWDGLASELFSAASSSTSITSGLTVQTWQGSASAAVAAAPYTGWLMAAAERAQGPPDKPARWPAHSKATQAATIHPLLVVANRNTFAQLMRSNR